MTKEFYNECADNNSNWERVHNDLINKNLDKELTIQLYEARLKHLEWRIGEYEKNLQS